MEAFEQVASEILWMMGYWVRTSVKVELTKREKRAIARPSCARWELDVVAYSGRDNVLRVVQCKSYLNSRGVALRAFDGSDKKSGKRFKLFNDRPLRRVVFNRLRTQLTASGACRPKAKVKLCLACGRIATSDDHEALHKLFAKRGWDLWDESWIQERLAGMSKLGYENQISAVVAKLLLNAERRDEPKGKR
jgi:hypothetical protein